MELKIEVYNALPCALKDFTINGFKAQYEWFVSNYDAGSEDAEPYCCGDRVTEAHSMSAVRSHLPIELQNLSEVEIKLIQQKLADEMVSGSCGWCE